ncbi:putative nucleotidyltransferase [Aquisphaera giovannonii]|uniref:Putative nucleotidyltransferase n=1 Tax=Aquisphaera giovannonii TaxID=406548 RepID=A0A5B9W353_9BACT|nr:nucleotidyltransferase domain-containing protein [Aquisphaera giovannonii]QEH34521.1 putative nucleotidyltransferase [Aquisphaera giovannonii]
MTDIVNAEAMRRLWEVADGHPYPLLFATISGAHLYGFPSPDSDYDLRGCHLLPLREVVGLDAGRETIEVERKEEGFELDLVSHDALKFFRLLLRKNGYVLEQVLSPLVVLSTPEHEELKAIARGCVTRHHSHHYFGFAETQWRLFEKERPRRVKPLLYAYRVLLTGIHLMRTGEVEADLVRLADEARLGHVADLIAQKLSGPERATLDASDVDFHRREYERLRGELESAHQASRLPEGPTSRAALNDLLVRLRLKPAGDEHG